MNKKHVRQVSSVPRPDHDGFPMKDVEKDYLLEVIKRFNGLYIVETLVFLMQMIG